MFPLWFKLGYTLFVAIVLFIYYRQYGPKNFLWFSDIALIVAVPALWLESSLLASMMAAGVLIPELIWNLSFFLQLVTGKPVIGLAGYMFDRNKPRYLRALSLFHVVLPPLLVLMVRDFGYDSVALPAQILLTWVVLLATYWLTEPEDNINWVYGLFGVSQKKLHSLLYLGVLLAGFPVLVIWPAHLLLRYWFG